MTNITRGNELLGVYHGVHHKRYILGITSLWLIIPLLGCSGKCMWQLALAAWVAFACSVSTLTYWTLGSCERQYVYTVDKTCAPIMFIALYTFFRCDLSARHVSDEYQMMLPCLVAILFLASRLFEVIVINNAAATLCHLTFRYIGFWWTYLALVPEEVERLGFEFSFVILSLFYWIHIYWSIIRTGNIKNFQTRQLYASGCLEIGMFFETKR